MAETTTRELGDPIAMAVFMNRLLSITDDIGNTLIRSSFSTNIKERRDCSVALFDARGRLAAQAAHVPLHLGSLLGSTRAVLEVYSLDEMAPGDAFVLNDPYAAGGTHMPDISIVTPIFHEGRVVFFSANIGHHADVGGSVPGSISGASRTVYEEGLRIPAVRIARAGEVDEEVMDLIALNSREGKERRLDLQVQIATNERGRQLVAELIDEMGLAAVEAALEDVLGYTQRRLRNRIRELPDGTYSAASRLDDDGLGGDPVEIVSTVTVAGERLSFDFQGSGAQARGAMNVARSALEATVYYAVKAMLDSELMPNSGMFAGVEITAPEGTIVNPAFPAAVGARSITCNKVARALTAALGQALGPEKAMAAGHDVVPAMVFSGPRPGGEESFVYLETIAGGGGARAEADGMEAVQMHMTNTSNLPVEALEHEYSLRVNEYALVPDSGGAGRRRGGLAIAREVAATVDGIVFSIRSDGHVIGAPGFDDGCEGATARLLRRPGAADEEVLGSKVTSVVLAAGEAVRLETPGGGGLGAPAGRPPERLALDLADGKVSPAAARRDYGPALVEKAAQS
jgi:N-methylhydantoinase B